MTLRIATTEAREAGVPFCRILSQREGQDARLVPPKPILLSTAISNEEGEGGSRRNRAAAKDGGEHEAERTTASLNSVHTLAPKRLTTIGRRPRPESSKLAGWNEIRKMSPDTYDGGVHKHVHG